MAWTVFFLTFDCWFSGSSDLDTHPWLLRSHSLSGEQLILSDKGCQLQWNFMFVITLTNSISVPYLYTCPKARLELLQVRNNPISSWFVWYRVDEMSTWLASLSDVQSQTARVFIYSCFEVIWLYVMHNPEKWNIQMVFQLTIMC